MIVIVDYGIGNVYAFTNAYKRLGIPCKLAKTPGDFSDAKKIIFPGVGSFDYAMQKLHESNLHTYLNDLVLDKKVPVLGICVGMQMLANRSEEGTSQGLGWIDAEVKKLPDATYPSPQMGWNTLSLKSNDPLLCDLPNNPEFYFLHSYYFETKDTKNILATSEYDLEFCAVVKHENIYGIQCHPEKSHAAGLTILKNFAELVND